MKLVMLALSTLSHQVATQSCEYHKDYTVVSRNPFRGFMTYTSEDPLNFPSSIEYSYVALSDVMQSETTFDFSTIHQMVSEAASRGNHFVFRLYLDYPNCCPDGTFSTGVPAFLLSGPGDFFFRFFELD